MVDSGRSAEPFYKTAASSWEVVDLSLFTLLVCASGAEGGVGIFYVMTLSFMVVAIRMLECSLGEDCGLGQFILFS